ncbi:lipocalin family protein [Myroides sp. DF42-4-2]|uniref:lipocalin family protein n=1 Tax=unclassified Myroides TaxID=2642485 RepID=UPI002576DAD4|nr:lipocalin family protein [Myroides sp. DF42-4-2]MDM1407057.1 lipocalin family protein [Myroides sp. DF42-4-2]
MRKKISLVAVALCAIAVIACKKQEATTHYQSEQLLGVWELSSAKIYDKEAKFLSDTTPKDDFGCGRLTWIYTTDQLDILSYVGQDNTGNCLEEKTSLRYTLQANTIKTTDERGVEDELLITSLTDDELVVMTALPTAVPDTVNAIKYVELRCKRVK